MSKAVHVTTLDSGLRVVTDPVNHVEAVSVGVWVGAGARAERAEECGVAHLLEHMAFKGTRRRAALDIAREIEAVGGHINAHTTRESTAYYAKVLKEDTALAVDVLADILQHSVFDPDELARERAVVLQEIGQANDTPDDIVFDHFQLAAFPDQPLGQPVLGWGEIVGRMGRETLMGYQAMHYVPSRMVLAASGNVAHDTVVALAEKWFESRETEAPPKVVPASYQGGDFREHRDLEQVHLVLGLQGCSVTDPDYYTMSVLANLLGGGMSSRLFQSIREERGLVYSIHAFMSAYHDEGLFGVYAGTGPDEVRELIPVLCDELAGVADSVTEDEVNRSRAQMKASLLMSLESTGARCEQAAQHMLVFGRVLSVEELSAKVDAVDLAGVQKAARRMLESKPTLAVMGPITNVESFNGVAARLAG